MTNAELLALLEIDFRFAPQLGGPRPAGRTLGALARQFLEDGGPPPVPRPTVGLPEGGTLPLFYPVLNAVAADSGVGKSLLLRYVGRQQVRAGGRMLALDCETTAGDYPATLMGDFEVRPGEMDRVHYATDHEGSEP